MGWIDDFNAGQLFGVRTAAERIDGVAGAETNHRDLRRLRMEENGEHSDLRMDPSVGQPALPNAIAENPDRFLFEARPDCL